ncbi:MAG: hypothetical protein AAFY76_21900 [Cyanobacteria bacterium J06649_11]
MENLLKQGGVDDLGNLKSESKEKPIPELSPEGFHNGLSKYFHQWHMRHNNTVNKNC